MAAAAIFEVKKTKSPTTNPLFETLWRPYLAVQRRQSICRSVYRRRSQLNLSAAWYNTIQTQYPLQVINTFKSDYVAAATAAQARISLELRPTISRLSQCVFFDISKTAYGRQLVFLGWKWKQENEKYTFSRKRKWLKPSKIFSAKNENEFRSVSGHYKWLPITHL